MISYVANNTISRLRRRDRQYFSLLVAEIRLAGSVAFVRLPCRQSIPTLQVTIQKQSSPNFIHK